jgi:hypothetical protein
LYICIYKGTAGKGEWSEKAGCVRLVEQVIQIVVRESNMRAGRPLPR